MRIYPANIEILLARRSEILNYALKKQGYVRVIVTDESANEASQFDQLANEANASTHYSDSRPGSEPLEDELEIKVVQVVLSLKSLEILMEYIGSFKRWLQPGILEDLAFLRRDRTPWLSFVSREEDAYFELYEGEYRDLSKLLGSELFV